MTEEPYGQDTLTAEILSDPENWTDSPFEINVNSDKHGITHKLTINCRWNSEKYKQQLPYNKITVERTKFKDNITSGFDLATISTENEGEFEQIAGGEDEKGDTFSEFYMRNFRSQMKDIRADHIAKAGPYGIARLYSKNLIPDKAIKEFGGRFFEYNLPGEKDGKKIYIEYDPTEDSPNIILSKRPNPQPILGVD